jgi:four helix bundle protein
MMTHSAIVWAKLGRMKNFRNLRVWQLAIELTVDLRITLSPQKCRSLPGLRRQVLRAATSVSRNIAEGCGRGSDKELRRFLRMSLGSLAELESELDDAMANDIVSRRDHSRLIGRVGLLRRMINRLIARLGE